MKTILCTLSVGRRSLFQDELELPGDPDDNEIEQAVSDWAHSLLEWHWIVETDEDKQS